MDTQGKLKSSQQPKIEHFEQKMFKSSILLKYQWNVQFSLVAQLCPTLCYPMYCSMPDYPEHHQLPELGQTDVHWVSDAIQPSHPFSSLLQSFSAFSLSSAGFRKGRGSRGQITNICWIIEKESSFQKKHLFLLYWLCQSLWLCGSQSKPWK